MEPAVKIIIFADGVTAGDPLTGLVNTGGFSGSLSSIGWNWQMVCAELIFNDSLLEGATAATAAPFKLADGGAARIHFLVKISHVDSDSIGIANGGNLPRTGQAVVVSERNECKSTDDAGDTDGDK